MRNKLYKSILLFVCLFISTTVINAATGSGSAALVNIRSTSIGGSSSKIAGFYNTTQTISIPTQETKHDGYYKTDKNSWNTLEHNLSEYGCSFTQTGAEGRGYYCSCDSDKYTCSVSRKCENEAYSENCKYHFIVKENGSITKDVEGAAGTYIHHYTITNSTGSSSSNCLLYTSDAADER